MVSQHFVTNPLGSGENLGGGSHEMLKGKNGNLIIFIAL